VHVPHDSLQKSAIVDETCWLPIVKVYVPLDAQALVDAHPRVHEDEPSTQPPLGWNKSLHFLSHSIATVSMGEVVAVPS